MSQIRLNEDDIHKLMNGEEIPSLEGYWIEVDVSSGEFHSGKGAMTDYELTLRGPEGDIYKGRGGYHTETVGHVFEDDVIFEEYERITSIELTFETKEGYEAFEKFIKEKSYEEIRTWGLTWSPQSVRTVLRKK